MDGYAALIVAYYPDERLEKNIKVINSSRLINSIFIIDNTPDQQLNWVNEYNKIEYIHLGANKGIATAQNIGLCKAMESGYDWVLTLDHDTIVSEKLIDKYHEYISSNNTELIGIINSDYYDINSNTMKYKNTSPIFVDEVISSGSLINLSIVKKIGAMEDDFFIDQVDNEYCFRLLINGYRIVVLPGKGFEHRLGNISDIKILFIRFKAYNQSPLRTYYRVRNIIWFLRKYNSKDLKKRKHKELLKDFIRIMFEKNRFEKYKMFFLGIKDGIKDRR